MSRYIVNLILKLILACTPKQFSIQRQAIKRIVCNRIFSGRDIGRNKSLAEKIASFKASLPKEGEVVFDIPSAISNADEFYDWIQSLPDSQLSGEKAEGQSSMRYFTIVVEQPEDVTKCPFSFWEEVNGCKVVAMGIGNELDGSKDYIHCPSCNEIVQTLNADTATEDEWFEGGL